MTTTGEDFDASALKISEENSRSKRLIGAVKTSAGRKEYPIASGVFDYFPDALTMVAHVSFKGSQQHNPGKPLHWDRTKSMDHADCLLRHFVERGTIDTDGVPHSAKLAWRALAILQLELEKNNA